jgi:hypothetical protein
MILLIFGPGQTRHPGRPNPQGFDAMKCRAIWPTLAGLLIGIPAAVSASADPAAIIGHLKGTTASRLDLSLARLSETIDAHAAAAGYGGFADVEDNDIVIRAYSPAAKPDEASCKRIVDRIKTAAGVNPRTGQPDDPASGYAALFSYPDDDEAKVDPSYAETVDSMFAIMVVIGETGDGKGMVCQSRLLSNKITYQKQ